MSRRLGIFLLCFYVIAQVSYFIADSMNHEYPFWEEWLISVGILLVCIIIAVSVIALIWRIIEYIITGE